MLLHRRWVYGRAVEEVGVLLSFSKESIFVGSVLNKNQSRLFQHNAGLAGHLFRQHQAQRSNTAPPSPPSSNRRHSFPQPHLRAREYSHPNMVTASVPDVATASSVRWMKASLAMMTRN